MNQAPVRDLAALVERFRRETRYPKTKHEEQKRLRAEWAKKLVPQRIASLSRLDLSAVLDSEIYVNEEYVRAPSRGKTFVDKHKGERYAALIRSIEHLCWGEGEVAARFDDVDDKNANEGETTESGFQKISGAFCCKLLALCRSDRFLPITGTDRGNLNRQRALELLGLPKLTGKNSSYQSVAADDALRGHLSPYFSDDTYGMAVFVYWLLKSYPPSGDSPTHSQNGSDTVVSHEEDLTALVKRFLEESGYPTENDTEQKRLQAEWRSKLLPENITKFTRLDLTAIDHHGNWSKALYLVQPGSGWMGSAWLQELDDEGFERVIENIRYLCWGDDELDVRYGALTDGDGSRKVKHFANHLASKLLAICHPDIWLPISRQIEKYGRELMLQRLGLPGPRGDSHGQRVVDANDRLRRHLVPHFNNDLLAMAAFLYWLLRQDETFQSAEDGDGSDGTPYSIDNIIDDGCFLERERLVATLGRLREKKNLILQGPPGTGKTWLAKRLAYALIGRRSESQVRPFQFHPNLSYEDFVRGWRPEEGIGLRLVDGPFLEAVEAAKGDPGNKYVLVIEEINRGNPAQIFGEMLTLLEADKRTPAEAISLSYRRHSAERVHIPPNLYVIGTMNVADRSLALVDFALRRRFAFVDLEPTFGEAWRTWVSEQCRIEETFLRDIETRLNALNAAIATDAVLGPHFQVGHSVVTPPPDVEIQDPQQWFRQIVETEIAPLLGEYWFDDPKRAEDEGEKLLRGLTP